MPAAEVRRQRFLRTPPLSRGVVLVSLVLASLLPVAPAGAAELPPANQAPAKTIPQAPPDGVADVLKAIHLPPGFRIDLFAVVPGARDLAVDPRGRHVFIGTMEGEAYVADIAPGAAKAARVSVFAPAIAKTMPHGVCLAPDGTLYLAEQNRILAFPDAAAKAHDPDLATRVVVPEGQLIPKAFESRGHSARVCRVGPDGRLYVTIGQPTNVPTPSQWAAFSAAGLGGILRLNTDGTGRQIYATGIRNSVGLDFNPRDRTLWFTDNQVDMMGDDKPPGELNRATAPGQNFGFPWYGGGHVRTREYAGASPPADVVFPQIEMIAHAADLGMTFYRGTAFPDIYRGGIFSAQHGSWNRSVPVGARVMFTSLKPDGTARRSVPFAEGWLAPDGSYRGRPVDVAEWVDGSLLVSDDLLGVVYRISPVTSGGAR